jgi:hypothetical protein
MHCLAGIAREIVRQSSSYSQGQTKDSYKILRSAAKHLLDSLSNIYPIDCRRTIKNIDESFIDVLPIRVNSFSFE